MITYSSVEIGLGPWHAIPDGSDTTVCGLPVKPTERRYPWTPQGTYLCRHCARFMITKETDDG